MPGPRILVVDDQQLAVMMLTRMLRHGGYNSLDATTSPLEAVRMAERRVPDLVLLDVQMAEMDGFALLERLRSLYPGRSRVPALFLTGDENRDVASRALEHAYGVIAKPFTTETVLRRVADVLGACDPFAGP